MDYSQPSDLIRTVQIKSWFQMNRYVSWFARSLTNGPDKMEPLNEPVRS
jgi:hypothetical protein